MRLIVRLISVFLLLALSSCTSEGQRIFNCNSFSVQVDENKIELASMSYFMRRSGRKAFDANSLFLYPDGKGRTAQIVSADETSKLLDYEGADDRRDIQKVCKSYPGRVVILTMQAAK